LTPDEFLMSTPSVKAILPHVPARTRAFFRLPRWLPRGVRRPTLWQREFGFQVRARRLERRFKAGILAVTALVVAVSVAGTASGRYVASWLATRARWAVMRAVGVTPGRNEVEADLMRARLRGIERTRGTLRDTYAGYRPEMRRLLNYAGLDPDHALLRWGNFDKTLYLPSTVFEADDTGRSYRLRPSTRSIWVRNVSLERGAPAYFPVPDGPELAKAIKGTGAEVVATSVQTTSSWGLRGPEPDTSAPLRGIALGDSYIQGLFVGDRETPTECIKRYMVTTMNIRTEVLNTGHLGYSTEQEYFTLIEYADRFRPRFVVLSVFANDFGDLIDVLDGKGNWDEGRYWLKAIAEFCQKRKIVCLVVPAPWVGQLERARRSGFYPGFLSNTLEGLGVAYFDPIEAFTEEHLRQSLQRRREGKPSTPSPLFNGHLGDGHFSPLGCELWARAVGDRLKRLLEASEVP
jgi:hypothetical protein